jgi:transposase
MLSVRDTPSRSSRASSISKTPSPTSHPASAARRGSVSRSPSSIASSLGAPIRLDETPIARGIHYALNQRAGLERFLADERLPLHNNASENALRRQAVGRANWTFLGNDEAGQVNAAFVSVLASCRLHNIEPWAYLRDLLCLIPQWPARRSLELAPLHWKQTLQQDETQRRLDDNVLRRITLE